MPNRCVVFGCSSVVNRKGGLSLHVIPYAGDDRAEAKKRREKWVDFVCQTRAHWTPGKRASICSKHFTPDDYMYVQRFILPGLPLASILKRDEFGICVWPTIHPIVHISQNRKRTVSSSISTSIRHRKVPKVNQTFNIMEESDEDAEQGEPKCKNVSTQTRKFKSVCRDCGKLRAECFTMDL